MWVSLKAMPVDVILFPISKDLRMPRVKLLCGVAAIGMGRLINRTIRAGQILLDAIRETVHEIQQYNILLEPLEARQLMSSATFGYGDLRLVADNGSNSTITVSRSGTSFVGRVNGNEVWADANSVKKIYITGGDHADNVYIDINFTGSAEIRTYGGNDTISSSNGNDTINSGDGNDVVWGNGGNDLINGTAGDDQLDGGGGWDTVWGETGNNRITNAEQTESYNQSSQPAPAPAPVQSTPQPIVSGTPTVNSLTLYNADTDQPIQQLTNGSVIDTAAIGTTHLTIVANATGTRSVAFGMDGNGGMYNDNDAPLSFAGDNNGNLNPFNFSNGNHTALATPFSGLWAGGSAGSTYKVSFTVKSGGGTTAPASTPTPAPAPTPSSTSTAGGPNVNISVNDNTISAGHGAFFNGLASSLNAGTPITAKYDWDFGDYNSKYNNLTGWNAGHVYNNPGNYTVRLTITNENRKVGTATTTVYVGNANRRVIYVSGAGYDGNDGSYDRPIQSIAKARQMLGSNTELLFRANDTFYTDQAISLQTLRNVTIGMYGSGNKPVLRYNGGLRLGSSLFYTGVNSDECTIKDLTLDSIYTNPSTYEGLPFGIGIGGTNTVVSNVQFLNLADGTNANQQPSGVMVMDSSAPNGLRGYFSWVQGTDQVYLGNSCSDSIYQHNLRNDGGDRILIANNTFSNPDNAGSLNKGCLTIHKGSYNYITGNTLNQGKLSIGPLGAGDGLGDKGARMQYVVAENNRVTGMTLVEHGAEHVMLRNNIFYRDNTTAIDVSAYDYTYGRGVVDLTLANNTVVNNGSIGNFLRLEGPAQSISLVNNLYLAPNLYTGANGSAPVFVLQNDLSSFRTIHNNVWPNPNKAVYAEGGINYIWPSWSNATGYRTEAEWDSFGQVYSETFDNGGYQGNNAPNWGSKASTAGIAFAGVFTDIYGRARTENGAWSAGAVAM
jgi:hypothetical protein